jgi:type IV secretory pathway VirB6-like protein
MFCVFLPISAHATAASPTPIANSLVSANGVCSAYVPANILDINLIKVIVLCLTNSNTSGGLPLGAVPLMAKMFLENPVITLMVGGISKALFTLGVVFMGIKLMYVPDAQVAKKDMWLMVFKIAGISWFISDPYYFFTVAVTTLDELMLAIGQAIGVKLCAGLSAAEQGNIWSIFGCIFVKLLGYGTGAAAAAGLTAIILASIFTGGVGFVVAITGLYVIIKLIFTVGRIIHIYVMAYIGIAFMFCVSFLFVPCYFFQESRPYFDKWLKLTVGYILTPIFLFAFVGFALIAMREIIFCGSNSVFVKMGGPGASLCTGTGDPGRSIVEGGMEIVKFMSGTISSDPGDAKEGKVVGTGQVPARASGEASTGAGSAEVTARAPAIDFAKVAKSTGSSSESSYLKGIMIALLAACLLIYVLYELLDYIPDIATQLAHGGVASGSIASERAVGEVFAVASVQLLKDGIPAIAKGFATGGPAGAKIAALQSLNKFRQDVGARDGKELR